MAVQISTEVLDTFGIKNINDPMLKKAMLCILDWVTFAQTYFYDPLDPDKHYILEAWQAEFLRWFQKGYVRRGIVKCPRGFGKSQIMATAAAIVVITQPRSRVGFFSTSREQAEDVVEKTRQLIIDSPFAYMIDKNLTQTKAQISVSNGAWLRSYSSSGKTTRGPHLHYIFMDEMGQMDDTFINEVVRPMGRRLCKVEVGLGTPFGARGDFYKSFENRAGWECAKCGIKEFEYRAEDTCHTCGNPISRFGQYKVFNVDPLGVSWMTKEKLDEEMARLGPLAARQECLAEFLPVGDTYFNMEMIMGAREYNTYDPDSPNAKSNRINPHASWHLHGDPKYSYLLSTDYGKRRDRGVIIVAHYEGPTLYIDYMESHLRMNYVAFQERLVALANVFNVEQIIPDGNGLGDPLIDYLERSTNIMIFSNRPEHGRGYIYNNKEKFEMLEELAKRLIQKNLKWPYHRNHASATQPYWEAYMLEMELLNFSYEIGKQNIILGTQSEHDDRVMALAQLVGSRRTYGGYIDIDPVGTSGYDYNDPIMREIDLMFPDTGDAFAEMDLGEFDIYDEIF